MFTLDDHLEPVEVDIGPIDVRNDIDSTLRPFHCTPTYRVRYPKCVITALFELYKEYNAAFRPLVEANREWATDYRYCIANGAPCNWMAQVDMVALPPTFLAEAETMEHDLLIEILRAAVFEFENSIAMYQMLEKITRTRDQSSKFRFNYRELLDGLRNKHNRPIALLAVTEQKYEAMLGSEFGKINGARPKPSEIPKLTGFDAFMGPADFAKHVEDMRGGCKFLLFSRTSDPTTVLKDPHTHVDHPLLGNEKLRRIIKAHTITMCVDAPGMAYGARINDTKGYMESIGMGVSADFITDLDDPAFLDRLSTICRIPRGDVEAKTALLRAKPMKGTYGCYGHVQGRLLSACSEQGELRRNWQRRGGQYIFQREIPSVVIADLQSGQRFNAIDRNFLGMVNGEPRFIGGVRSLMPIDSFEANEHRNHGNAKTVMAEVYSD
jgi:hypothetical protein